MEDKANYLGEQLVGDNIITQDQLERALEVQKEKASEGEKVYLGNILIELGFCSDEELTRVLAEKHNVPYFDVEEADIDEDVIKMIPHSTANKYKVFPLKLEGNKLKVAMMNPKDVIAIDDLRMVTGKEIQPVLIKDSDLEKFISKVNAKYGTEIEGFDFFKKLKKKNYQGKDEKIVLSSDSSSGPPPVELLNKILSLAAEEGADELHIEPHEDEVRIRFRIDGVLRNKLTISSEYHEAMVSRIKVLANMDISDNRTPQDGRMSMEKDEKLIDIRADTLPSYYGERITLRLLFHDPKLLRLANLGFTEEQQSKFKEYIWHPFGCILVGGYTGSGKSTTLYAALSELNTENKNIITVEDPVERQIKGLNQIQYNKKAGMNFSAGLRSILRNHPDVIMVGEIRDAETGVMAAESALTGHLVMSTIHASDSAGAIERLLELGIKPHLIEPSLTCVLSQRLLRKLCNNCKGKYIITNEKLLKIVPDFPAAAEEGSTELYRARGCSVCNNTGYKGRIGVFELLEVSDSIRKAVREAQTSYNIREIAAAEGMTTLRQCGFNRVKDATTSVEEFKRVFI